MDSRRMRERLLAEWARYVADAARQGAFGAPVGIERIRAIAGPRAGALELYAGLATGQLRAALARNEAALLRQFVPWQFLGEPAAYLVGRALRLEAGWPRELAETLIRLGELGQYPKGGGRWIVGRNEYGHTVVAGLNDATAHYLVSGTTGSGKSVALRAALLQLSADPGNRLVLLDGKYGESLIEAAHLPGVVGPVALEGPQMRAALGWVCGEMRRRYEGGERAGRVIVVFDEFQEAARDEVVVDLLRKIAAQGRGAGVHLLAATQHPAVAAFGDRTTRRNLTGKLAFLVADPDASRAAVGARLPRADYLLGQGDAYAIRPGMAHRLQCAYVEGGDLAGASNGRPWEFDEWPAYDPEMVGQALPEVGWSYSGEELAQALVSASEGEGRPTLVRRLEGAGLGRPGAERAIRLLRLGREAYEALAAANWDLCQV